MDELKVVRWKRYGHDRLYANLPDGTVVGWADCETGKITVLRDEYREVAMAVLVEHSRGIAPASPSKTAAAARPLLLPPLIPADDLATNAPGLALRELAASGPAPWARAVAWLLRRPMQGDSWQKGLAGERR